MCQSPNYLHGPSLDSDQYVPLSRRKQSPPLTCWQFFLMQPQCFLQRCIAGLCLTSTSFFAKYFLPTLSSWMELFLPRCRAFQLLLLNFLRFLLAHFSSLSKSPTIIWSINPSLQVCIVCKYAKCAICPVIQVINEGVLSLVSVSGVHYLGLVFSSGIYWADCNLSSPVV